jgi:cation transporter-like permease
MEKLDQFLTIVDKHLVIILILGVMSMTVTGVVLGSIKEFLQQPVAKECISVAPDAGR